jgi:hypothetical protein
MSSFVRQQRGVALLATLIVAVLLSILGLSLTLSSLNEFAMSNEFENHERAVAVADAGFSIAKDALRGQDLTTVLNTTISVPKYIAYTEPLPGTFGYRNPLFPLEARSIDFQRPPSRIGTRTDRGFLTPATGALIGTGRFFAKASDNSDEEPMGGADDPYTDQDATIFLRVVGVHRNIPSETVSYGGTVKNSVAIIEGMLRRDMTFNVNSPFTVYGPGAYPNFDGNSFIINGYDHSGLDDQQIVSGRNYHGLEPNPGVSVVYDDPTGGDAAAALQAVIDSLNHQQQDNIIGSGPDPSVVDQTQAVRDDPYEDATNIFDPQFMASFLNKVGAVADYKYPPGTHLSGSNILLGTVQEPKITVANGDFTLSGGGSGAGIMVVRGTFNYSGAFHYKGIILVIGEGQMVVGGANKSVIGGVYLAKLIDQGNGQYTFGAPTFSLSGNSNFYLKKSYIRMGISLLPLKTLSWREITPEIEPQQAAAM